MSRKGVLIPLLLDDPLWETILNRLIAPDFVLIPLLLDDPLWVEVIIRYSPETDSVLIPLLLDDPLWVLLSLQYWLFMLLS